MEFNLDRQKHLDTIYDKVRKLEEKEKEIKKELNNLFNESINVLYDSKYTSNKNQPQNNS